MIMGDGQVAITQKEIPVRLRDLPGLPLTLVALPNVQSFSLSE